MQKYAKLKLGTLLALAREGRGEVVSFIAINSELSASN